MYRIKGKVGDNDGSDAILRPVCINVSDYRLQVYNRNGYKVFESAELHRGWDGYLNNGELATQGVYIWLATGTFADGTRFRSKGDVTFIH